MNHKNLWGKTKFCINIFTANTVVFSEDYNCVRALTDQRDRSGDAESCKVLYTRSGLVPRFRRVIEKAVIMLPVALVKINVYNPQSQLAS